MTAVAVVLGAALGAPLRYLVDLLVQSRHESVLPLGTLVVNLVGSTMLGAAAATLPSGGGWYAAVGTGFCGALTTFSTASFETVRLAQERQLRSAASFLLLSVGLCLAGCAAGWQLGSALT